MSNLSLGTGKMDCQDMLKHVINDNIVIFHWQEKRVSDNVARISIVGCEDSSLPVLTFRATGFATTFETPQHAEAFVVNNTAGFIHVGNIRGDAYIQDRSIAEQLRLHLVLTSERTILSCELTFASSGTFETLN
ncbi:MAG: hypothetical protein ACXV2E_07430 [Halobacteriota archaeon]